MNINGFTNFNDDLSGSEVRLRFDVEHASSRLVYNCANKLSNKPDFVDNATDGNRQVNMMINDPYIITYLFLDM